MRFALRPRLLNFVVSFALLACAKDAKVESDTAAMQSSSPSPAPNVGPDGKPHFMKGMVKPFTVVAAAASSSPAASMPEAEIVAKLTDYDFGMPDTLRGGQLRFDDGRGGGVHG